jgi:hypothetical protein
MFFKKKNRGVRQERRDTFSHFTSVVIMPRRPSPDRNLSVVGGLPEFGALRMSSSERSPSAKLRAYRVVARPARGRRAGRGAQPPTAALRLRGFARLSFRDQRDAAVSAAGYQHVAAPR